MFVVGGESLIDLKAEVALPDGALIGRDAEGQIVMTAHPGGSPYNCAIALAKLGNKTGFLCPSRLMRSATICWGRSTTPG
jgi:fructokinase